MSASPPTPSHRRSERPSCDSPILISVTASAPSPASASPPAAAPYTPAEQALCPRDRAGDAQRKEARGDTRRPVDRSWGKEDEFGLVSVRSGKARGALDLHGIRCVHCRVLRSACRSWSRGNASSASSPTRKSADPPTRTRELRSSELLACVKALRRKSELTEGERALDRAIVR